MTDRLPSTSESSSPPLAEQQWTEVDHYFSAKLLPSDAVLDSALEASTAAGLPAISVSPNQGKFLQILAQLACARSILEVGTLGGYSTIWLARGMQAGGRIITLEVDANHAKVAELNLRRAGLQDVVEVRVGNALETLPQLAAEGLGPFDLIFIDADKQSNPVYFEWSMKLSRPGTLIIVDNVVRNGAVTDSASTDPSVQGVRRLIDALGAESRASGTVIQTVGIKGYDGFAFVLVGAAS